MCGIIGIHGKRLRIKSHFESSLSKLSHRGPDDSRIFEDRDLLMGFRRLAIIDLNTGQQPIVSPDERYVITFNGEIYNFKEERALLEKQGHSFSTKGDAEVILHLFMEYGPSMVARLNGIFAIAIFDRVEKELYLFRDHMGVKPLYFFIDDDGISYSSELNALCHLHGGFPINKEAIYDFLSLMYIPAPWTVFEGVKSLEPGHYLKYSAGEVEDVAYFRPDFSPVSHQDQEEIEGTLYEAVRRQLLSDVPLGAFLSGGVDSSLVCLAATLQLSDPLKTFCAVIEDEELNERPFAKEVAERVESQHFETEVPGFNLNRLPEIIAQYGQPFADSSLLPTYLISEQIKKHVTVVVGGDGSDELFGGYGRYNLAYSSDMEVDDFFNKQYFRVSESFKRRYLLPGEKDKQATGTRLMKQIGIESCPSKTTVMRAMDWRYFLEGDILQKVDISSMAHSLEARVPFLDQDLIKLAMRIPDEQLFDQKNSKKILKEILSKKMSRNFAYRKKVGFMLPIEKWIETIATHLKEGFETLQLWELEIFDPIELKSLLAQKKHSFESAYFIFGLYVLNSWLLSQRLEEKGVFTHTAV